MNAAPRSVSPVVALLLAVLFSVAADPAAASAPDGWAQFQGDAAHSGSVADGVQAPFKEAWHLDVPQGGPHRRFGLSAPVLAGRTVIAVGPNQVIGVDLATGERAWAIPRDYGPSVTPAIAQVGAKQVLLYTEGFGVSASGRSSPVQGARASGSPSSSASPATPSGASASATPAPGGSTAFDSHVAAIDVATRDPEWDAIQLAGVSRTGVTVDGDVAFVGDDGGTVYAVDVATGHLRWTAKVEGVVDTSLAVSGGRVFVSVQGSGSRGSSGSTYAAVVALHEEDGSQAWRYDANREVLATAPSVEGSSVFLGLAGVSSTVVRSLDAASGAERWSTPLNTTLTLAGAPTAAPDGVIGQDVNSQVYRLDARTGSRTWDFALNEPAIWASPVRSAAQVLVVTNDGRLAALDAGSGELVWESGVGVGSLRDLLVTSDLAVAVRGGPRAGLVAYAHDPAGSLVRVASPTTVDAGRLIGGFALGAVPLVAIVLAAGRWLGVRAGPAFETAEQPEDAWGDDEAASDERGDTVDEDEEP